MLKISSKPMLESGNARELKATSGEREVRSYWKGARCESGGISRRRISAEAKSSESTAVRSLFPSKLFGLHPSQKLGPMQAKVASSERSAGMNFLWR